MAVERCGNEDRKSYLRETLAVLLIDSLGGWI